MGILSDRIGAQLAEMRARHALVDREIADMKQAPPSSDGSKQPTINAELAD